MDKNRNGRIDFKEFVDEMVAIWLNIYFYLIFNKSIFIKKLFF
jgi:hypothetical protein